MNQAFETFPTITALSTAIRKRELSPVKITEQYLDRIDTYNDALNAYLCITADRA